MKPGPGLRFETHDQHQKLKQLQQDKDRQYGCAHVHAGVEVGCGQKAVYLGKGAVQEPVVENVHLSQGLWR